MQPWVQTALGASAIVSILVNVGVLIALFMIYSKLSPVLAELRGQVKRLGEKGNEIATTAKATVDRVHDRTEQMLGTAQNASAHVTQKVGAASTALTALFVTLRVLGFARGLVAGKPKREIEIKRIRA